MAEIHDEASKPLVYVEAETEEEESDLTPKHPRRLLILLLLFFINLVNYLDRYSISGVLPLLQKKSESGLDHDIDDSSAGLLTTLFIVAYMIFSPIFGYLGDRYSRKILICVGVLFWSVFTLGGSFATTYWELLLSRALVGIGEASYATIAPTVIADLYAAKSRTMMLSVFYLAIPVGASLGYLVGSFVASALGSWRWAFRFSPGVGVLLCILYFILTTDPRRGATDGQSHHISSNHKHGFQAFFDDFVKVIKVKSFFWSTLGFTAVTFSSGALAAWAPTFVLRQSQQYPHPYSEADASFIFGAVTCATGVVGTLAGSYISQVLSKYTPKHDPWVCGVGLLVAVAFMSIALPLSDYNLPAFWFTVFLGELALCLNWAPAAAVTLYVVPPERRSTAEAVGITMTHMFGDAASPYIIGTISDHLREKYHITSGDSMMLSLFLAAFVALLGGFAFLRAGKYVAEDRVAASIIAASQTQANITSENGSIDDEMLGYDDHEPAHYGDI